MKPKGVSLSLSLIDQAEIDTHGNMRRMNRAIAQCRIQKASIPAFPVFINEICLILYYIHSHQDEMMIVCNYTSARDTPSRYANFAFPEFLWLVFSFNPRAVTPLQATTNG